MNIINAIVVDDEARGRSTLIKLLKLHCPQVQIIAECGNANESIETIKKLQPQLVFLDIEMPYKNGFEVINELQPVFFKTIFITAHSDYAIQAFRYSAIDYLLKPVDIDELIEAVNKVEKQLTKNDNNINPEINNKQQNNNEDANHINMLMEQLKSSEKKEIKKIVIHTQEGMHFIQIDDIVYCESEGSYTKIHCTDNKKLLVSKPLNHFEDLLVAYKFYRVHRQYLINLTQIKKVLKQDGVTVIMNNDAQVDVSRRSKESFFELLEQLHI